MTLTSLITWSSYNPDLALSAIGGIVFALLALSFWGIRRAFQKRRIRRITRPAPPVAVQAGVAAQAAAAAAARADSEGIAPAEEPPIKFETPEPDAEEPSPDRIEPAQINDAPEPNFDEPIMGGAAAILEAAEKEFPVPATAPSGTSEYASSTTSLDGGVTDAAEIRMLVESVFEENFPKLHPVAYAEARQNFAAFAAELAKAASERLSPVEMERVSHADIQLLLHSVQGEIAKRRDDEKYNILVSLLIGRIQHHENRAISDLLDGAIDVVRRLNVDNLRVVVMCLYLRSLQLRSGDLGQLETVVKFAAGYGAGADFSNLHTGSLFAHGLLMYNSGMDRLEGNILRAFAEKFGVDFNSYGRRPGETTEGRYIVHQQLHLDADQTAILEAWGNSQCGRATATGVGWAAAAAYIERQTGKPADWERVAA